LLNQKQNICPAIKDVAELYVPPKKKFETYLKKGHESGKIKSGLK
jgi:hypothetical protein